VSNFGSVNLISDFFVVERGSFMKPRDYADILGGLLLVVLGLAVA
jgi:hypothetical protein